MLKYCLVPECYPKYRLLNVPPVLGVFVFVLAKIRLPSPDIKNNSPLSYTVPVSTLFTFIVPLLITTELLFKVVITVYPRFYI